MPRIPELPPDLDLAVLARLEAALRDWLHWLDPVSSRAPTGACWSPERLESAFSITATTTSARVRLRAPEHLGGDIDWHSFVRSEMPAGGIVTLPQHSVLPAPVRYPGMPLARLWEVEDGNVNLDLFGFQTGDIGVLALLAFVHQHANDWFSVPVELPTGTITAVRALSATTTFGERIPIPAAALLDGPGAPWQLFAISPDPEAPTGPVDPASPLVLAHSAGHHLTGPVVEDVLLVRDEMANLAWAVEGTTQDLSGQPVDRFARYQRLRPPAVEDVEGARRYRLGSTVPDNWYPLEAARDAEGSPVLALSRLPGEAADVSDLGVQGTLLDHGAGAFVYDEEVPREGALIVRRWHRARWTDGRSLVWASRLKRPGRREGSSGLRFDYLAEPGTAGAAAEATRPNLLRNPDFARGRLVAPGPLVGGGVPGQSAAEDWTLWNNPVATTSTQLEPTTRLGGTGHMLRIATSSPACGLVQQWAPTDSGPAAAVATAWVYVVRGSVMMGCGNGGDTGMDVATRSRGRWELIEAPHGRSPVNEIILYAADSDGAEFLVDHVAVRVG